MNVAISSGCYERNCSITSGIVVKYLEDPILLSAGKWFVKKW